MKNKLSFEEKYAVIGTKGTHYEGIFITAVKTTGIFCRPSCRARKPKAENVNFYDTNQEAIQNGFRPCKICKPMEKMDETPTSIQKIINELHQNPYLRINDDGLKQRGVEPSQIRRWFKLHHHMTFHAYQRMFRINSAFNDIKKGKAIIESAFDSGFESLSSFNDSYQTIFGDSASRNKEQNIINIVRFTTPVGPMFACATEHGICLLEFTDKKLLEAEFKELCKKLKAVILPGKNPHLDHLQVELKEYFSGTRRSFSVPLDSSGTEFQLSVWQALNDISFGETRTYKQQALSIGNEKAVRAVAAANGKNRISIIIPCHRVIGSDGSLTGYAGGLHRKQWLLDLESKNLTLKCSGD